MENKPQDAMFWKSKTFWTGALSIIIGIFLLIGETQYKQMAPMLIITGLTAIGIRDAQAYGELFKQNK